MSNIKLADTSTAYLLNPLKANDSCCGMMEFEEFTRFHTTPYLRGALSLFVLPGGSGLNGLNIWQ